jgi:hypothetical protein
LRKTTDQAHDEIVTTLASQKSKISTVPED